MSNLDLTDREIAVAKEAARLAVLDMSNQFYQQVGKTVVSKVLIWIGMFAVGYGVAHGWISFSGK